MSLGERLAVVGIIVAIMAIVAGVLAARRWGNRRKRLLFQFRSIPLIPVGTSDVGGLLKVTFHDLEVPDPHLLTILLKNVGPADIASDRFDAGRSLVIRLNCTMYGLTTTSHPQATVSTAMGAVGAIEVRPHLLRRGEEVVLEAVISGSGAPELESPLIDTDVVSTPPSEVAAGVLGLLAGAALRSSLGK